MRNRYETNRCIDIGLPQASTTPSAPTPPGNITSAVRLYFISNFTPFESGSDTRHSEFLSWTKPIDKSKDTPYRKPIKDACATASLWFKYG